MKIYMDVCCLCRPFDDQTLGRIRLEITAVQEIIRRSPLWGRLEEERIFFTLDQALEWFGRQAAHDALVLLWCRRDGHVTLLSCPVISVGPHDLVDRECHGVTHAVRVHDSVGRACRPACGGD